MGLRERLENLVANPLVVDSTDFEFAKGLLDYYNKKGSLTTGRRPWLDKLEMKYNPENYVDPLKGNPEAQTIVQLLEREDVADGDKRFLTSLKGAIARWGKLTDRQFAALERIAERYSEEGKKRTAEWSTIYADRRPEAIAAANYYAANPPYYGDLAERILTEPDFIPTEKQFNAITQNKYAQKVIKATFSEPLFAAGAMVEGRASAHYRLRGKKAFVLKVNHGHVTNAAKGTKKYLVLPVGEPTPLVGVENASHVAAYT